MKGGTETEKMTDFPAKYNASVDDTDVPPPYTEAPLSSSSSPLPSSSITSSSPLTSSLAAYLASLPDRLRAEADLRAANDLEAASAIVPHVSAFFDALSRSPLPPRRVAELVAVPAAAVPAGWALSGAAERRREGELVRVARVVGPETTEFADGKGDEKGRSKKKNLNDRLDSHSAGYEDEDLDGSWAGNSRQTAEFDDWGRWDDGEGDNSRDVARNWWWADESMARRIAVRLHPKETVRVERRQVQAAVEEKSKKRGALGLLRKRSDAASPPAVSALLTPSSPAGGANGGPWNGERANIVVRAEEVTFRKENEMGMWESLSGFGVVVTVKIRGA